MNQRFSQYFLTAGNLVKLLKGTAERRKAKPGGRCMATENGMVSPPKDDPPGGHSRQRQSSTQQPSLQVTVVVATDRSPNRLWAVLSEPH